MAIQIAEFDNPVVLEVEPTPDQTVSALLAQEEVEVPENFSVFRNGLQLSDLNTPTADGDVLMVIPPVEGGC